MGEGLSVVVSAPPAALVQLPLPLRWAHCPRCGYTQVVRLPRPIVVQADPLAQDVLTLVRDIHRRTGRGALAGQVRDELGVRLGRTALYNRFAALRRAGLVRLEGKRWRPAA